MPAGGISGARALGAMRAWRRGVGALEPWSRATPFASAHHYRGRGLARRADRSMPAAVAQLLQTLPSPEPHTLWIFDLPGPHALWLAYGLRRRFGMAAALAWNGWYDPRGALDGQAEIPLLLWLGSRLGRLGTRGRACLLFDSQRHVAKAAERLDNRYALGEEDAPGLEDLNAMGFRRVRAWVWAAVAEDLAAYLGYLRRRIPVRITEHAGCRG